MLSYWRGLAADRFRKRETYAHQREPPNTKGHDDGEGLRSLCSVTKWCCAFTYRAPQCWIAEESLRRYDDPNGEYISARRTS
jgi:hypothetical protein